MYDKKALRPIFRKKRKNIKNKDLKNNAIMLNILNSEKILNADTVLIYASIESEVATFDIMDALFKSNKIIAVPKCIENGTMTFHIIDSLLNLHPGKYGIPEPDGSSEMPLINDNTVCIVPGLAFTIDGGRLGYGGGYYDRFLADHSGLFTIGLAYEELITDTLPVMSHDLKVNAIATEERMVLCSAE